MLGAIVKTISRMNVRIGTNGTINMRTIVMTGLVCYGVAELSNYMKFVRRYHRFNGMRIANHTRAQIACVIDRVIASTPGIFERAKRYSVTHRITDRESLIDAMHVESNAMETSANELRVGRSKLFRLYKPIVFNWFISGLYHMGTIAMRRAGYVRRVHATEIGDYTVWTRTVEGTKPIVMFPGFGLGAVPFYKAMKYFGRTVHIVEMPNLGYSTANDSSGYMTSETIYRVVRAHVGAAEHDIMAHSIGSSPAAHYVNYQHTDGTVPANQVAVICDGFVCPVDGITTHVYPCTERTMYNELIKNKTVPMSRFEFFMFLWFVINDLNATIFLKRFHNLHDGVLWRDEYRTSIRYVFGERDMLYDVPFIRSTVERMSVEQQTQYRFIPKASHGGCFFGKRRDETLSHIVRWFDGSIA